MSLRFAAFTHARNNARIYINPDAVSALYSQEDKPYTVISLKCGRVQTVSEDITDVVYALTQASM